MLLDPTSPSPAPGANHARAGRWALWLVLLAGCCVNGTAAKPTALSYDQLLALDRPPRSVVYKRVGERALRLDFYLPRGPAPEAGLPAVLVIHGGGWRQPGLDHTEHLCRYLAHRGVVAVNVTYRLVTGDGSVRIADCLEDCRDALAFVRARAKRQGVDPGRIAVAGDSAGGQLAAMLALTEPDPPAAALLYAPVLDLTGLGWMKAHPGLGRQAEDAGEPTPDAKAGGTDARRAEAAALSPIRHVARDQPPMLLIHGEADKVVPIEQAEAFAAAMREHDNPVRLEKMAGWGHAFLIPGYGSEDQIVETLRRTDRFLHGLGWVEGEPTLSARTPPPRPPYHPGHGPAARPLGAHASGRCVSSALVRFGVTP